MARDRRPEPTEEHVQRLIDELRRAIWAAERDGRRVTPAELARNTAVSRQSVYAYLSGATLPPNDVFDRLLSAIGVTGPERGRLRTLRDKAALARRRPRGGGPVAMTASGGSSVAISRQLPPHTRYFVGRSGELRALTAFVDLADRDPGTALIAVISGGPGTGKTTLALRWAHQVIDRFPDGQLYVNLHGFDASGSPTTPTDALRDFLEALGVPQEQIPPTEQGRAGLYRSLLAEQRVLLVLDNARDADQVRPLLPAGPHCMVVATSRDPLAGLAAQESAEPVDLDVLTAAESVELLEGRLGHDRLAAEPEAVAAIVEGCGRLPLALSIVATRATGPASDSLAVLADQLRDERTRLEALDIGEAAADVRSVFAWSYRWLGAAAARLFRLLGLVTGREISTLSAASLAGISPESARRCLRELVRTNLVQQPLPDRFTLHDLLRAYAQWLVNREDSEEIREAAVTRLFDHYVYTASLAMERIAPYESHRRPRVKPPGRPCPSFTDERQATAWLDAERRNLVATSRYATDHGWLRYPKDLGQILYRYLITGGHHTDAEVLHSNALRSAQQSGDVAAEAGALRNLGGTNWLLERADVAVDQLHRAIAIFDSLRDSAGAGRAHNSLGLVYLYTGQQELAQEHLEQAVDEFRRAADRTGESDAQGNLGILAWLRGRYPVAIEHFSQLLATCREVDDRNGVAIAAGNLGTVYQRLGQYEESLEHHRQALATYRATGNRAGQASTLTNTAIVAGRLGRHEAALDRYREALAIFADLGDREHVAETRAGVIHSLYALDQADEADGILTEALYEYGAAASSGLTAGTLNRFAAVMAITGRNVLAAEWHRAALVQARSSEDRYETAWALDGLARLDSAAGHTDEARRHWHEALSLYGDLGVPEADAVRETLDNLVNQAQSS